MSFVRYFEIEKEFPRKDKPMWSNKIQRWNQLDEHSNILLEASYQFQDELHPRPDLLILASFQASNTSDYKFAHSRPSPAKFVHTLPNVRGSLLCLLNDWTVPLYTIQSKERAIIQAIEQCQKLTQRGQYKNILIAASECINDKFYKAHFLEFCLDHRNKKCYQIENQTSQSYSLNSDRELFEFLKKDSETIDISNELVLKKTKVTDS